MLRHQKKLKVRLKELGIRQTALAFKLGMATPVLCNQLNGHLLMPFDVRQQIEREILLAVKKQRKVCDTVEAELGVLK